MATWRRLFSRIIPIGLPYVFIFVLGLALWNTPSLEAAEVSISFTGTTTGGGRDLTGFFVLPGASLDNYEYLAEYTWDDTQGVPDGGTYPPDCTNGLKNSGVTNNPGVAGALTINGRTYRYNFPRIFTASAFQKSANATSPKMSLSGQIVNQFGNNLHGSEYLTYSITTNTTQVCRSWSSAYAFTATGTDTVIGTLQGTWGLNDPFSYGVQFTTQARPITTSLTISGGGSSPLLATISGADNGCQAVPCASCQASSPVKNIQMCGVSQISATDDGPPPNVALPTSGHPMSTPIAGARINGAVGNMVMTEIDYVGPGNSGLIFARTYNSLDTTDVGFGQGWHTTYHHGLSGITSSSVTVVSSNGKQNIYTLSGGSWVPQANVTAALATTTSPSGYKLTRTDDTIEYYNTSGQLTSIANRGLVTTLSYSTTGLTSVTGPFGHSLSFSFNALGKVTTMTLPNGTNKVSYAYDDWNQLSYVINPDGTQRTYGHDGIFHNLITALLDENGTLYSQWYYDANGRAISSELAAGVDAKSLTYTSTNAVTVTDALGNTTSYSLTKNFGLTQPTAVNGIPSLSAGGAAFSYSTSGFLSSRTDFNGNVTQYTYNVKGQELTRTEAYGTALQRVTTTTWHATLNLPTRIDEPLSRTTTFGYDANGNLTSRSITDGVTVRTTTYTYGVNNLPSSMTDALGHTTTWTYDGSGNVTTMVNALGQVTTYNAYDGNGRLTRMTNPLGLVTTLAYDANGRMTSKKVGGLITTYSWDPGVNKVDLITYPDSSTLQFSFDDAHRLIEIRNTATEHVDYTYDDNSNVINVSVYDAADALKATHTYSYDSANRVLTSVGSAVGDTTTYGYDNQGNVRSIKDPLGNTTTYTYDALNRLKTIVDALNSTTSYDYDSLDNLLTVKDPLGLTTTYTYNVYGDVLSVISPDTGTTLNSYNAGGLLVTTTDSRGQKASYAYDVLNRTTSIAYASGPTITYLYDTTTNGIGSIGQVTDPAGTTTWAYDQFSRVTRKSQTTGALTLTTTYTYDASGRLSTMKYPSAKTLTYSYDSSGRVNNINFSSVNLNAIAYFPFGPAKSWNHPNATAVTRAFDMDGRITSTTLNGTTTNVQTVTYDVVGRITALSETATVFASSHTFGYDNLNRLTSFFNGTTTTTYSYDANGNRLSSTLSGTTTYNYPGTSNRLTSLSGTTTKSFAYDALGNTTSDGTNVWTYDARGRMSTLLAGATTAAYGINGFGQRISKTGNTVPSGGTNLFLYDEMGNLIGEYGSTGTAIQEFVNLPDTPEPVLSKGLGMAGLGRGTPLNAISGTTSNYSITPDWQGTPHIIADSAKNLRWTWDRYAFGDNAPNTNPKGLGVFTCNQRFPGQYADAESGLNYNGFRDYNPTTGRYIQADPIGLGGGQSSLYPYVNSHPMTYIDPRGLDAGTITWPDIRQSYPIIRQTLPAATTACALIPGCIEIIGVGGTIVLVGGTGYAIHQMCSTHSDSYDDAWEGCHEKCLKQTENVWPDHQRPGEYRKCMRACLADQGFENY